VRVGDEPERPQPDEAQLGRITGGELECCAPASRRVGVQQVDDFGLQAVLVVPEIAGRGAQ